MKTQVFGDIRVDMISEFDFTIAPDYLLAGVTKEEAAEHLHWLGPRHMEEGTLDLKMSMHAYLIRTRHHTILFDTCCGNDKERSYEPTWHRLQNPFLERLARAGVLPEQVDFVMCSHLHADHIGWNTRLLNGEWVPTFPNARYLISKGEFKWWREAIGAGTVKPYRKLAWDDSVLPVVDRGLAMFVEDDHVFESEMPDEVRYMPLHGHTRHHCGLYLCSQFQDAIFSGDAIHHPIQLARPDWLNAGYDAAAATQTLRDLIARCVDTPTKLMTAHFATPTAGCIVSGPGHPRFRFDED
ncbi:MBL fold metallo-hydrolase [Bradyrhizobium yuanmingense]|uniref:MBL fold metallo-hydrolase n=1 Tax=Bradyrhizobium yuanmingense TaxID=108015 RepID=UPI0023B90F03|nr:MBL fold metallo-hydrolase [Bradyrhizobium yuanmingense]MDF0523336.1 MBL fold metallo-hydrolase [Bradyrhizobium yuanmingense]